MFSHKRQDNSPVAGNELMINHAAFFFSHSFDQHIPKLTLGCQVAFIKTKITLDVIRAM